MPTSYGILSTYSPTQCGLATFSKALLDALSSPHDQVAVVRIVDSPESSSLREVHHQWVRGSLRGTAIAAAALNTYDVAIIQHEYGIFGGPDGADVLELARALTVPLVVVMHTVLTHPTYRQRTILQELARHSVTVVTMTHTARQRLTGLYGVDPASVRVIPHGAADNRAATHSGISPRNDHHTGTSSHGPARSIDSPPVILTWGLLGEGKGIEWAIEAMASLRDLRPAPLYRVVGQTHPRVIERHGERYRQSLVARADRLGVSHLVDFDARYLATAELHRLVRSADVVLLPYDSREQVTSGVLIEAVAAGKPVVSTGFPHARELLGGGAGLIVERQDPAALAQALRRVLTEPGLAPRMTAAAHVLAPDLLWPAVADQYRDVAATAVRGKVLRPAALPVLGMASPADAFLASA